jgi:hypothetical protein
VKPAPSLVSLFVHPLNQLGIEYMVTGGLASVIYGQPRLTLDVDLVLRLSAAQAEPFSRLWPPAEFYVPPLEVLLEESQLSRHGHFNISHHDSALRADIYIAGDEPLNDWALRRTVTRSIEGVAVRVAPLEAVILGKLRYYRLGGSDRHLRDIAQMVRVSGAEIDLPEFEQQIRQLGFASEWTKALAHHDPA